MYSVTITKEATPVVIVSLCIRWLMYSVHVLLEALRCLITHIHSLSYHSVIVRSCGGIKAPNIFDPTLFDESFISSVF